MKKIAPILLLRCLSFNGIAAYHYNTMKDTKATCEGDKNCKAYKNLQIL